MTTIIFRFFEDCMKVYAVKPDSVADNTEPCIDLVLTFDNAGKFVTAELVRRNEGQTSDDQD